MKFCSKTGLMELAHKYRSVLKRCVILNAVVFGILISSQVSATDYYGTSSGGWSTVVGDAIASGFNGTYNEPDGNNVYGGFTTNGNASQNTIFINDLRIETDYTRIIGGYTYNLTSSNANENLIYLNGNITFSDSGILYISTASSPNEKDNTLVIGKNASFQSDTDNGIEIYLNGYYSGPGFVSSLNNSLEVWTKGIKPTGIENFNNLYFVLPITITNNDVVLSVEDEVALDSTTIGVATQSGVNLNNGDKITLIDKTDGGNYSQADMSNVSLKGGSFTTDYTFSLDLETLTGNNGLVATVSGKSTNDEIKAPAEGQVSSIALLNAGSDLIANTGMENAQSAAKEADGQVAAFGAISGGYSKYKTGSHINLSSASLLTGFAKQFTNNFMSGVFVEAGYGDYSTHNNLNKGKVKGDGNSKYYGLGFMGRYDLTKNFYAEASIHGGYLNNDWKSNDTKVPVDYNTDSLYYGAHFGMGYETDLNKTFELGIYGKYFYTHQKGDDASIDGTKFDFKGIDSHLTRLGTRLYYSICKNIKPFMGGAWDHEFDGKVKSYAGEIAVDTPTLKGDTGMLEFGLKTNNLKKSAWDVDASLQGFFGHRKGVQGVVKAKYPF